MDGLPQVHPPTPTLSTTTTMSNVKDASLDTDNKEDIIHAEGIQPLPILNDEGLLKASVEAQMKSTFDSLSTKQAISVFRKTVLICTVAGFCAATDGESPLIFTRSKIIADRYRIPASTYRFGHCKQRVHQHLCSSRFASKTRPQPCLCLGRYLQVRSQLHHIT